MTRTAPANEIEARELALYTINTGELYRPHAQAIIANLAARKVGKTYKADKALILWGHHAKRGADAYRAEFGPMDGGFTPATRALAAVEIAEHYADELRDTAADLRKDAKLRDAWPLWKIARDNESAGKFFFSADTMRFFGDTMGAFAVRVEAGKVYVVRVKPPRKAPDRTTGLRMVGERREFNPKTGDIGVVIRDHDAG